MEKQIVGIGPVDPSDFVDVSKTLGRDQSRLRAGALENGIDRNRRSVEEKPRSRKLRTGLRHAGFDALHQMSGRRQRLAEKQCPAYFIKCGDIGKGSANVSRQPDPRPGLATIVNHSMSSFTTNF